MKNFLFICSRNKWRSRTAETIYKNNRDFNVKSAGTENSARVKVNAKLISWADTIFVMEKHHKNKIVQNFPQETIGKDIVILEIPDVYRYMDEELVGEIKDGVQGYL